MLEKKRLDDLETAKVLATALAVRSGLIVVYDQRQGAFRVFGDDGRPATIPTLSEFLAIVFDSVDAMDCEVSA